MAEIVMDKTIKIILITLGILAMLVFILVLAKPAIFDWLVNQAPTYNYTHDEVITLTPDQLAKFDCVLVACLADKQENGYMTSLFLANVQGTQIKLTETNPGLYLNLDNEIRVRELNFFERLVDNNPKIGGIKDNQILILKEYLDKGYNPIDRKDFIKINGAKLKPYQVSGCNHPICKTEEEYKKTLEEIKKLELPTVNQIGQITSIWFGSDVNSPVTSIQEGQNIMMHINWDYGQQNCQKVRTILNGANLIEFNPGQSTEYVQSPSLKQGANIFESVCILNRKEIAETKKQAQLNVLSGKINFYYYNPVSKQSELIGTEIKSISKEPVGGDNLKLISSCSGLFSLYVTKYKADWVTVEKESVKYSSPVESEVNLIFANLKKEPGNYELSAYCVTSTRDPISDIFVKKDDASTKKAIKLAIQ
ncbi:MAG: hypothetical protein NT076_01860 [Candidatus Pacearchaeota archaeon]|nr:hypothetical protein [Candidatus Pacearchaeota archaeon]